MRRRSAPWLVLTVLVSCAAENPHKRPDPSSLTPVVSFGAVWDDPVRCEETVGTGLRQRRPLDAFRVGTWNIKWFPDGKPGDEPEVSNTDVPWLACTIAYLDVDVLGLQEIKLTERGKAALDRLTMELQRLTGAAWKWEVDGCKKESQQHVALLYRTDRAELTEIFSDGGIDPTARKGRGLACPGRLRPALTAYVRSLAGGVDFHFATAHLDSGRGQRDLDNRMKAWSLVADVQARSLERVYDDDFIVAADFNLMGCEGCEVADSKIERERLAEVFAALPRPLRLAAPSHPCTQYYEGEPSVIDLVVLSKGMREAAGAGATTSGLCAASECRTLPPNLPTLVRLSDHCPVLFDVRDVDLDEDPPGAVASGAEPPVEVPSKEAGSP